MKVSHIPFKTNSMPEMQKFQLKDFAPYQFFMPKSHIRSEWQHSIHQDKLSYPNIYIRGIVQNPFIVFIYTHDTTIFLFRLFNTLILFLGAQHYAGTL